MSADIGPAGGDGQNEVLAHLPARGHRYRNVAARDDIGGNRKIDLVLAGKLWHPAGVGRLHDLSCDSHNDVGANLLATGSNVIRSSDGAEAGAIDYDRLTGMRGLGQ